MLWVWLASQHQLQIQNAQEPHQPVDTRISDVPLKIRNGLLCDAQQLGHLSLRKLSFLAKGLEKDRQLLGEPNYVVVHTVYGLFFGFTSDRLYFQFTSYEL